MSKFGFLVFSVVILSVITYSSSSSIGSPPRPIWPQYMAITSGLVICSGSSGGPPCSGKSNGVMHAWWEFDNNGIYTGYREDAVLGNTSFVYNREYAFPEGTHEYFLLNSSLSNLGCVSFYAPQNISRYFMEDAIYNGMGNINNQSVYVFTAFWEFFGKTVNITAWVNADNGLFYGWSYETVTYIYLEYVGFESFDPALFGVKPDVKCAQVPEKKIWDDFFADPINNPIDDLYL